MNNWQEVSLSDVADFVTDKISASKVTFNNYISTDNMQVNRGGVVPASTLPQASKFNYYKPTDTLFSNIRTYFRKVWLADRDGGASPDVLIFRTKNEKKLSPLYLYYLVSGQEFVAFTVLTAKGAKMPRGDKDAMMQFRLHLPSPDEQIEIVEALRCIDQKIELNQRMNETLEGMARAIFKSWFVDFDPVHAKAEGRDPEGMDSTTATLFPSTFTPDGLPEGWHIGKISGLCKKVESGGTPSRKEPSYWDDGNIPWLTSGEVRQTIVIKTENFITESGLHNSSAKLWPPLTTVVAMYGATAGQVTLLACETTANQACCALIPESHTASYIFLKAMNSVQIYEGKASGSAQQNLNKSIVSDLETLIPPKEILEKFEGMVAGLIAKMIANEKQNQTLAALRDTLLPKLISGELRIDTTQTDLKEAI